MALTPQEMQELAELEELEALEAEEAKHAAASMPQEQGLKGGSFNPANIARTAMDALGFDTAAAGPRALNSMTMGYLPQIVGGAKALAGGDYVAERDKVNASLAEDARRSPVSSTVGTLVGGAAAAAPMATTGIVKNAAVAAGAGAAYNPGDEAGKVDPIQAGGRAKNAALSALIGAGVGVAGKGIQYGAQKAADVRMVKDGAGLAKNVKGQIDKGLSNFNEQQIAPRMDKLRSFLKGKSIEVNPERIAKGGFEKYAGKLTEKAVASQPQGLSVAGGKAPVPPARVSIPAERGLRLKQSLDSAANYGKSKPHDPSAVARGEDAFAAANSVRSKLSELGPEVDQINSEVAERLALRNALDGKTGTSPIEAIQVKPGTSNYSLVKSIDEGAGSDLVGLGERIKSGQDLLLHPSKFLKPLEAPNELRKGAVRGASSLAEVLNKLPQGTGQSINLDTLEAKRKNR
jgi:hypothetical protein